MSMEILNNYLSAGHAERLELAGGHPLTDQQVQCLNALPEGHTVIGPRGDRLIVRCPDGQLARVRPSGRLVAEALVESVQSYLHVCG